MISRAEAKKRACSIVNNLIESYRCVGQPYEDLFQRMGEYEVTELQIADANRLHEALCILQNEMLRRGHEGYPAPEGRAAYATKTTLFGRDRAARI